MLFQEEEVVLKTKRHKWGGPGGGIGACKGVGIDSLRLLGVWPLAPPLLRCFAVLSRCFSFPASWLSSEASRSTPGPSASLQLSVSPVICVSLPSQPELLQDRDILGYFCRCLGHALRRHFSETCVISKMSQVGCLWATGREPGEPGSPPRGLLPWGRRGR